MKFKKKKSFWKEFFNECAGVILAGAVMIFIILSMIVGNLILPCISNGEEINPYIEDISDKFLLFLIKTLIGGLCLFEAVFVLLFIFAVIGIIVTVLAIGITHTLAVRRYTYLPLTTDEVKEAINAELFKNTPESYVDYLTKQVGYFDGSIAFSKDDMKMIIKTVKEIWNESFKLNKDFLIRSGIKNYHCLPFGNNREVLFHQLENDKTIIFNVDKDSLIWDIK